MKREIVAASLQPDVSVSMVARRYDVNANQVFAWRRLFRDVGSVVGTSAMVPVMVNPEPPPGRTGDAAGARIEIELGGGYRIHVGSSVRAEALRLVLDVLERR